MRSEDKATDSGPRPAGTIPQEVSRRRSRLGWWVPVYGMPVLLALSAVLAGTKATPPGIGVIAFFWFLGQSIWAGGPTIVSRQRLPWVDQQRMLVTGRGWTGRRTLDLAQLSRVLRVKWTFGGDAGSRRVDYVILIDRAGVWLSVPRYYAEGTVRAALARQRENGLPEARVSRFAAMGLGLAPDDVRFRFTRMLVLLAGLAAYVAVVGVLIVQLIPALAGYHGG